MEITLINGDCNDELKSLPQNTVDLVCTDPPYNISRANNFTTMGRAGLEFGEWDKEADIVSWIKPVFNVIKSGGSLIIFNAWRNLGLIADEAERAGFCTKDLLRLEKTNPMPRNRDRRYITDYELALWFVKPTKKWTFNRQDPVYQRPKFVKSVERGLHPTQKNLSLMEDLITIHSNKGDLVLDPFMGSGTTGLACKNLGRNFIGIELDKTYFETAITRIEAKRA